MAYANSIIVIFPFISLNLAFIFQTAYAAPLILLAQTRQADRDKAHTDADARHREDPAQELSERIEVLTREMHARIMPDTA